MDGSRQISRRPRIGIRQSIQLGLPLIALWAGGMAGADAGSRAWAGLGLRRIDPAQVVPLDQIAPESRESVAEVIRDHTFHRQGEPETFACDPTLYSTLINEPDLTLALWRDLSTAPVQLRKLTPNRYEGTDGQGASGTWDYVLRSPQLHVMLAYFNYVSPRGNAKIDARIVLVVRTSYFQAANGGPSIQHSIEAFVKVDSHGWKTVARTFRPVIEKALEDQVQEAGLFVSLMSRVVVDHPTWACQVVTRQEDLAPETKQKFRRIVLMNRRPDASDGRPVVAQSRNPNTDVRRR
jgi:hypothetical protein